MRITARFDEEHARRLEALQRRTGKTRTQILREALDLYFRVTQEDTGQANRDRNRRLLARLAGIAAGPSDLSERYKEALDYV